MTNLMKEKTATSEVRVTIIIPTYKRADTLGRALDSVLSQTLTNIQVIVVDDNHPNSDSRIETSKLMERYSDNTKVEYVQHENNKNGSAARNTGLKIAKGEYISFLDDDDEYEPNRLEIMCNYMDSLSEEWGACYSGYIKFMENGAIQTSAENSSGNLLTQALMRSLYIGSGSNLFIRKSVIKEIGFFDESFERNQDLEFLVRALKKFKMSFVNQKLLKIHYDKRTVNFSFEQSLDREIRFEKRFQKFINELSQEDKRKVEIMYGLDRIRMSIGYKKYGFSFKYLISRKIPPNILLKYFVYGLDRTKNNTCYGFYF